MVVHNPGQGDGKGDFGLARGYSRHRCRGMVKSEKHPLVVVGAVANGCGTTQEHARN